MSDSEKHAYFPSETHKNTKSMRFSRGKQGVLQNATPPHLGGLGGRFSLTLLEFAGSLILRF